MSDIVTHEELQSLIMNLMFDAMNQDAGWLGPIKIGEVLGVASDRIALAATALVRQGHLRARHNMRTGSSYQISESGYVEIEEWRRQDDQGHREIEADPILALEAQLAPAADRMVSFGDNQDDEAHVLAQLEEAQRVLNSSNLLDSTLRDETNLSLETWKNLAANGRRFAIGAFRYLVWDRLKAVVEGGIEDAYRVALTAIIITLGTIIIGLL